jgi:hypothetical protein
MADNASDDRWSVRGVPASHQAAAVEAAARANIKVGPWISAAIERAIAAEREPVDLVPARAADAASDATPPPLSLDLVITAAATLAGARGVPAELRRRGNAALIACLPPAPAREPGAPVRRRLVRE